MKKPLILMLFGFLLIGISLYQPLVTTVIDDTPPTVTSTIPGDGQVYQYLALITVWASDPETGIQWIHYTDNSPEMTSQGKDVSLNYKLTVVDEGWESSSNEISPEFPVYDSFPGVYTPGTYSFQFEVSNDNAEASLTTIVAGQYTIYTALEGDWYVNDILILDPLQELHFNTRTLTFKFVMTGGSTIVATSVSWTGGDSGTMSLIEGPTGTWEGSYIFPYGGTYTIELRASDGTTDVVMSIVQVGFPGGITMVDVPLLQLAGGGLVIVGAVMYIRGRKKQK